MAWTPEQLVTLNPIQDLLTAFPRIGKLLEEIPYAVPGYFHDSESPERTPEWWAGSPLLAAASRLQTEASSTSGNCETLLDAVWNKYADVALNNATLASEENAYCLFAEASRYVASATKEKMAEALEVGARGRLAEVQGSENKLITCLQVSLSYYAGHKKSTGEENDDHPVFMKALELLRQPEFSDAYNYFHNGHIGTLREILDQHMFANGQPDRRALALGHAQQPDARPRS